MHSRGRKLTKYELSTLFFQDCRLKRQSKRIEIENMNLTYNCQYQDRKESRYFSLQTRLIKVLGVGK